MKIVYAGGGTGGHINPALSIADYVKEKDPDSKALFIGTKRGLEKKLVPAAGYDIEFIDIQGFDRKRLWRNASTLVKLVKANQKCKKLLKEFGADAVVCTGGYVSGPVAMAAGKLKIPALIVPLEKNSRGDQKENADYFFSKGLISVASENTLSQNLCAKLQAVLADEAMKNALETGPFSKSGNEKIIAAVEETLRENQK